MEEGPAPTAVQRPDADELPMSPLAGCVLSVLIGLAGAAVVFAVGTMATRGEIAFGTPGVDETRLWIVSDEGYAGLALSTTGAVEGGAPPGGSCIRTQVRFFLWRAAEPVENQTFCDCYAGAPLTSGTLGPCAP